MIPWERIETSRSILNYDTHPHSQDVLPIVKVSQQTLISSHVTQTTPKPHVNWAVNLVLPAAIASRYRTEIFDSNPASSKDSFI